MNQRHRFKILLAFYTLSTPVFSSDLNITPSIEIEGVISDNINQLEEKESSTLTRLTPALDLNYESSLAYLDFFGEKTFYQYLDGNDYENDVLNINSDAYFKLGSSNFKSIFEFNIKYKDRNDSDIESNSLTNADTIRNTVYKYGVMYEKPSNSNSLIFELFSEIEKNEDGIDNKRTTSFVINGKNNKINDSLLWEIDGDYKKTKSDNQYTEQFDSEIIIGRITSYNINPYLRFFNEGIGGSIETSDDQKSDSIGIGLNYKASNQLQTYLSYNTDYIKSEKYIETRLIWSPSERTKFDGKFEKRFYGETLTLSINNKYRFYTTRISYRENLESFNRDTFNRISLGNFICSNNIIETSECDESEGNEENTIEIFEINYGQSREYSLNKTLNIEFEGKFKKTNINLETIFSSDELVNSGNRDESILFKLDVERELNSYSKVNLGFRNENKKYIENINETTQKDLDKFSIFNLSYSRNLNSTLNTTITTEYLKRKSEKFNIKYNELRLSLSLKKEF